VRRSGSSASPFLLALFSARYAGAGVLTGQVPPQAARRSSRTRCGSPPSAVVWAAKTAGAVVAIAVLRAADGGAFSSPSKDYSGLGRPAAGRCGMIPSLICAAEKLDDIRAGGGELRSRGRACGAAQDDRGRVESLDFPICPHAKSPEKFDPIRECASNAAEAEVAALRRPHRRSNRQLAAARPNTFNVGAPLEKKR